jgi:hypothetical protein
MFFELQRIRNNLMTRESDSNTRANNSSIFTITMIRLLSDDIKFLMLISSKNFTLKILSSRFSQKSNILIRFIHEVLCDVLIDATMLKSGKEKSLREKSEDIVLLITMTTDKVHIYDETEELTNRADVCWREKFETIIQREKTVKDLYDRHQQNKTTTIVKYRACIREWILVRRTWEYALILDLFLGEKKSIIWSNDMTKKNLINYNAVVNNLVDEVLVTIILNETVTEKKKVETDVSIDSSKQTLKSTSHDITEENTQVKTSRKSKTVSTTKRRRIIENQLLHSDLQACIILNFLSVNITSEDDAH